LDELGILDEILESWEYDTVSLQLALIPKVEEILAKLLRGEANLAAERGHGKPPVRGSMTSEQEDSCQQWAASQDHLEPRTPARECFVQDPFCA
jgi:hypothetical protein